MYEPLLEAERSVLPEPRKPFVGVMLIFRIALIVNVVGAASEVNWEASADVSEPVMIFGVNP